jgi:hypothetical protein
MMNRLLLFPSLLVLLGIFGGSLHAHAQQGPRMYDPAKVDTVEGAVTSIDTVAGRRNVNHQGIHLQVTTDASDEPIIVHVGPLSYLQNQGFTVQSGDAITVRGARVKEGAPVLIAAELWTQNQSIQLRNDQGQPAWRGQGPGTP